MKQLLGPIIAKHVNGENSTPQTWSHGPEAETDAADQAETNDSALITSNTVAEAFDDWHDAIVATSNAEHMGDLDRMRRDKKELAEARNHRTELLNKLISEEATASSQRRKQISRIYRQEAARIAVDVSANSARYDTNMILWSSGLMRSLQRRAAALGAP